jgi:transcriptional regulator with XRE-family HTH domain
MRMKEAIVARFQQLCREHGMAYNELATRSGVTPSTVYSMMDARRKDISVVTVKKLCDGLEISVPEFFSGPLFEDLEQKFNSLILFFRLFRFSRRFLPDQSALPAADDCDPGSDRQQVHAKFFSLI